MFNLNKLLNNQLRLLFPFNRRKFKRK